MALYQYMNDFLEKRRFPRHHKKLEVKYLYQGSFKDGLVQNLSLGGLLFKTKNAILVNSPVQLVLELPFGIQHRKCVLHGKVIRVKEDPYGFWPEVVCSFDYSSKESIRILNEFFRYLKNSNVKLSIDDLKSSKGSKGGRKSKIPTWWTNPGVSISVIKRQGKSKKKSLIVSIKEYFKKFVTH